MPDYRYRAKDGPDHLVEGVIEASSETAAIEKISQLGYVPILVSESGAEEKIKSAASLVLKSKSRSNQHLIFFSRHLSSLLKSGVPLLKALYIIHEQEKDRGFRSLLQSLWNEIKQGKTLSEAMNGYRDTFPPMYAAIVKAGEGSGALQESLLRMSDYLKKQEALRSKVRRAMAYPVLLGVTGLGTIFFIVTFVVPKLTKLFLSLGQELPLATRVIMGMGAFMQSFWWAVLAGLFLIFIVLPRVFKKILGQDFFDDLKLKLPFIGPLIIKVEFARFARTLEMSLSNGISFLESLRIAIPTLNNLVLREALEACYQKIQKGDSFGRSLRNYPYFPHFVSDLISIGEESGRLDEVLLEITQVYDQDIDEKTAVLTTLLEPAMILVVGAIVGFIVIAMLLPIFEMNILQ